MTVLQVSQAIPFAEVLLATPTCLDPVALTLCARTRNANITLDDVTTLSWAWATFECHVTIITSLLVNIVNRLILKQT